MAEKPKLISDAEIASLYEAIEALFKKHPLALILLKAICAPTSNARSEKTYGRKNLVAIKTAVYKGRHNTFEVADYGSATSTNTVSPTGNGSNEKTPSGLPSDPIKSGATDTKVQEPDITEINVSGNEEANLLDFGQDP